MSKLLVLKLGGSLITDKTEPYSLRPEVIEAASKEIKQCIDARLVDRLIVVHGVGSYGHPPVIQYKLYKGFTDPSQLLPLSITQKKVNGLREVVTEYLQKQGLPVNLLHTSSIAVANRGELTSFNLEAVKGFLSIGMVPVLGGDVVYDSSIGFSICSGDKIAVLLAQELKATDLVFATDVSGVYDMDPKKNLQAKLIREISLSNMSSALISTSEAVDASGTMKGKLDSLKPLSEEVSNGLNVGIISMMKHGRLYSFLNGDVGEATRFKK